MRQRYALSKSSSPVPEAGVPDRCLCENTGCADGASLGTDEHPPRQKPAEFGVGAVWGSCQQDQPILDLFSGLHRAAHALDESLLGVDKMVRGIDHDGRVWISRAHVCERQKDSRSRITISRLSDDDAGSHTSGSRPSRLPMTAGHDRDFALRMGEPVCPVQCMLKHRPRADERAVLFRSVPAEPTLDERPEALAFATGQDD